ncbi:hypothetical protein FRC12_004946 [Ceratobasidium sp. 428]|nr:hypothetical protein FRC12_004946 [Ceratobasidium sp. 428]
MGDLNRSVASRLVSYKSSVSDFSSVQSSETTYEEKSHETTTQESDLSGASNAAYPVEGPFNNINTKPASSRVYVKFLKNVIKIVSPRARVTYDLTSRTTQVELLSLLARRFDMELGRQSPGDIDLLNMAIGCQSQALAIARGESMMKEVECLGALGDMLHQRWKRLDDISDIGEAIECARQVMILDSWDDQLRAAALDKLGLRLQDRFERLGHLADINQGVEYQMLAVQLTPDGDADKPGYLNSLAVSLFHRYHRIGNRECIDRAIECQVLCVELTPDGHQSKPALQIALGHLLKCRHIQHGNLADIDQAIKCYELAIQTLSEDHPDMLDWLMELGCSLERRFERTCDLSDLNKFVECRMMAVRFSPAGHPERPLVLDKLAGSLVYRYLRLGSLQDLDLAVQYQNLAVELASNSEEITPDLLSNLGYALRHRYERLGNPADMDRAIEYQLQAVQLVSGSQRPYKAVLLCMLARSLQSRYRQLGNTADLDLAIKHMSLAVQLDPDGHSLEPELLGCLGMLLSEKFEGFGNLADIDLAIDYYARAVKLTPNDHPNNPSRLLELGRAYETRSRFACPRCASQNVASAVTCWKKAANPPIVDPKVQIGCAGEWARYSLKLNQSPLEAFQAVFTLLPHFVWLGQTVQARYDSIPDIHHVVSRAVAWAISVGSYDLALEWLEQGRLVIWTQQLQTRTPSDDLAAVDPQLADRMRHIASQLEAAELEGGAACLSADSPFVQDLQGQRHDAALQWEQLLQEVRQLAGFEDYMLPRKAHILKKAATRGPVVVINTTHCNRCDALIIFPDRDDITHVPLVRTTPEKLYGLRTDMVSLIGHRGDEDKPRGFKRTKLSESTHDRLYPLKVLWSDVVEPILDALQYTNRSPQDALPYITWCTTGVLSFLPLHAAGLYDGASHNAFDLVVSSYTPTLAALLAPNTSVAMPHAGVLAVGQANTPGKSPLPKTVDELAIVGKYTAATGYHQLDGSMATIDAALDAMEQYSWVHLACHAIQDRADPRHSAFYLHDGRLTLETITRRAFKHKGLAFLSACQTATGDDVLPDEAMHLAAGMLAAGYPTVIATMWSIKDEDGPEVAEVVYEELARGGKMDHTKAAMALHNATKKLRDKVGVEEIWRWAPFIHIGL